LRSKSQPGDSRTDVLTMLICGVDEAGRGPLAGPVYAAAVILDPANPIEGLKDSKVLSAPKREALALIIKERALGWYIAFATAAEIDEINILQATLLAMQRAVQGLAMAPSLALVDGNRAPKLACEVKTIIKGDASEACISAASILAKTERDAFLLLLHYKFPHYNFKQHKGYPTAAHLNALKEYGPCPEHRRSFGPVRRSLF
jgi:ribonuclease HII